MAIDAGYTTMPARSPSPSAPLVSAASQSASPGCPPRQSALPAPYHHSSAVSFRPPTSFFPSAPFPDRARALTDMFFFRSQPPLRTLAFAALSLLLLFLVLYPASLAQHFSDSRTQRPHGLIFESDASSLQLNVVSETQESSGSTSDYKPPLSRIEIERRILAAAPILGYFEDSNGSSPDSSSSGDLANWMSSIPDQIPLTEINIPGTHDSATWNYTQSTQLELEPVTGKLPPSIAYQCQDRSLFRMLGDGIRFFDLRVGFLPGHKQLGFYHAAALLSTTATVPDVFLGFYKWLDAHPTETVLVSIKVDNATFGSPPSPKQPSSVGLQEMLYELLTQDELGRRYWLQQDKALGTLGEARGKLVFIQRIDWTSIRARPAARPIGIPLPPAVFADNKPFFSVVYNDETGAAAFVEDLYNLPISSQPVKGSVAAKMQAVQTHLARAACEGAESGQLFITFASGGALKNLPPVTPKMLALGTGNVPGVNARLKQILEAGSSGDCSLGGQRLGIVILDWYGGVEGLVEAVLRRRYE